MPIQRLKEITLIDIVLILAGSLIGATISARPIVKKVTDYVVISAKKASVNDTESTVNKTEGD